MATGRNDATNVGIGKPRSSGAIFVADYGTEVPTDGSSKLDDAFECLGYVDENGLTISQSVSNEEIVAWGGDVVARPQTEYSVSASFACLEVNPAVLKLAYGADNVDIDEETGQVTTVRHVAGNKPNISLVAEVVLDNDRVQRIVMPLCSVTDLSDITYEDGEAVKHEFEIGALPDATGTSMYDYFAESYDPDGDDSDDDGDDGGNTEPDDEP